MPIQQFVYPSPILHFPIIMPPQKPTIADAIKAVKKYNGNTSTLQGKRYIHLCLAYPSKNDAQRMLAFNNVVSLAIDPSRTGDPDGLQILLENWRSTLQIVRIVNCKSLTKIGAVLEGLKKLREFHLDNCPLNTKLANSIATLSDLREVSIQQCGMTSKSAFTIFTGCQKLESIHIYEPKLSIKKLGCILELKKLRSLSINF